jgi:hypothetical protein
VQEIVAHFDGGRVIAQPDAGRAYNPDAVAQLAPQRVQQWLCAEHRAGQAVADPHRQRRNGCLAFFHNVEMGIEGRRLEHFGEGEAHFIRERGEVGGGDLPVGVLDEMQMLDQQIALAGSAAQQRLYLGLGARLDLAALRNRPGASPVAPWMVEPSNSPILGAVMFTHQCP